MAERFMQNVLTPSVLAAQEHYYGRQRQHRFGTGARSRSPTRNAPSSKRATPFTWPPLRRAAGLTFSIGAGTRGFLRVVSPTQLAFADYKGNRQMLSTGNLAANDRVALFLMDYPRRERLKILGHARVEDARQHAELVAKLAEPEVHRLVERLFFIEVISFDWNCPKYITPRYTAAEVEKAVEPLRQRIAELEAQLKVQN